MGWSEIEAGVVAGRRIFPPTRRDLATAAVLLLAGIAWGAALRFAGSLPVDFGFLLFLLQFGLGLVFVIGLVFQLLFRGFNADRVVIAAMLAAAAPLAGNRTYCPSGRDRREDLHVRADAARRARERGRGVVRVGERPPAHRAAHDDRPDRRAPDIAHVEGQLPHPQVELAGAASSTLFALGDAAVAPPPDETTRGPGDRTGAIALDLLQVNLASGPTEVNEVRGTFRWTLPGPAAWLRSPHR